MFPLFLGSQNHCNRIFKLVLLHLRGCGQVACKLDHYIYRQLARVCLTRALSV